jgi:hypothetical protein
MKLHSPTIRRRGLIAATALGGAIAVVAAPAVASASAPFAAYSASVSPANVKANTANVETVKFQNQSPLTSLDYMKKATVTFPGFSSLSAPATVTDSSGNSWTVAVSQQTVTLNTSSGGTAPGGTLSVPVTATAPASTGDGASTTSVTGAITGILGNFTDVSSPKPSIGVYGDAEPCPANTDCTSTTIGDPNGTSYNFTFHNTTGVNDAAFGRTATGQGIYGCSNVSAYVGDSEQVINSNGTGTFTLSVRVDKSQVNAVPNNGAGNLSYCGHTPAERGSWTQADGSPATLSADGLYYTGIFPACTTTRTVNCVSGTIHKNGQGDAVATIQVVGGNHDPGGIMGIVQVP